MWRLSATVAVSLLIAALVVGVEETDAFHIVAQQLRQLKLRNDAKMQQSSQQQQPLFMAKKASKRGGLASIVDTKDEGSGVVPSTTTTNSNTPPRSPRKAAAGGKQKKSVTATANAVPISPDLLKFMQGKTTVAADDATASLTDSEEEDETGGSASAFTSFDAAPPPPPPQQQQQRRIKQNERQQMDDERAAAVSTIVEELEAAVAAAGPTMIDSVLHGIRQLLTLGSAAGAGAGAVAFDNDASSAPPALPLKRLLLLQQQQQQGSNKQQRRQRLDYRLAWAGSDAAVCAVGTGLHKVPLARLQEVFLTLPGRNRVQYTEVIRILGPFPNVKNTLQGSGSVATATTAANKNKNTNGRSAADWKIVWDSMIDGTGKELLAGKAENTQTVQLNVHYSDEQVIVATTLPGCHDVFQDQGQHVLLFVRDDAMDEKLEALRVA